MAYLVLARKYRPRTFADMVGQEHVTRTLQNAIATDRVHHAYLFCGVRGLGKTTAARILAKCLVCERGPAPEPCNACDQCRMVDEGRSVDVVEIDGASNNKVEHIHDLRERIHYLPQSARRKIYIIDEVHMLSSHAFNALLKTLEEPPPHVTFAFATTDPQKVLPTILSRVSRLDYRRVPARVMVPYLNSILAREKVAIDDAGLRLVARASEGSMRDALTSLDKILAFARDPTNVSEAEVREVLGWAGPDAVADLVDAILGSDAKKTLELFERITGSGTDAQQLGLQLLQHLRDLTVLRVSGERELLFDLGDDHFARLEAQAKSTEARVLAQHFDRFTHALEGLESSRTPGLIVEMALLELTQAEPMLPLGDLLARLDAIGRGSGEVGPRGGGTASTPSGRSRGGTPEPTRRAAPVASPATASPNSLSDTLLRMAGLAEGADADPREPVREPDVVEDLAPPAAKSAQREPLPSDPIDWRSLPPFEAYEALLMRVRDEDELLYAVLFELGLVRIEDGFVELACEQKSVARHTLRERPELEATFEHVTASCFGERMQLRLVDATPGLPEPASLSLVVEARERERRARAERDAEADPGIQRLLHLFDGAIESVEPP